MTELVLASTSPARLAVLRSAGVSPRAIPSHVDEDAVVAAASSGRDQLTAAEVVAVLARAKAEAVAHALPDSDALVFGGDSAFECQGEIWGKPHTPERARERIRRMSGSSGVLYSGHWVIDLRPGHGRAGVGAVDTARVHFGTMSDQEVDDYVATGEPLEVAGSFTLDGRGQAFITRVEGAPSCVIGLSTPVLRELVHSLGVPWTSLWEQC